MRYHHAQESSKIRVLAIPKMLTKLNLRHARVCIARNASPLALAEFAQEPPFERKGILRSTSIGSSSRTLQPIVASSREVNDRNDPTLHQLLFVWAETAKVNFNEPLRRHALRSKNVPDQGWIGNFVQEGHNLLGTFVRRNFAVFQSRSR
jgi:hypothetical protein